MRRLVIAIDCDDVLVSTGEMTIAAYNRKYGTNLTPEFYYDKATLATWGTDDDLLAIERVMEYERSPEYALIGPAQETVDVVNRLAALHELHLVTGRPDHLEEVTLGMLERYFPGCFTSVEHTNFYNEKKRTKGEVCKLLGAEILVDDHIGHGESVLENGMKEVIIFGDYPWNRHQALSAGMVRCFDWLGVEREINRIANAQ